MEPQTSTHRHVLITGIAVALALFAVFIIVGWVGLAMHGTPATKKASTSPATPPAAHSISSPADITSAANPKELAGLQVSLFKSPIVRVFNDRSFTIGNDQDFVYVYAYNDNPSINSLNPVKVGEEHTIVGTIRTFGSVQQVMDQFRISQQEAEAALRHNVYVEATTVSQAQ